MTLRSVMIAVAASGVIAAVYGTAHGESSPGFAEPHRTIVLTPDRPERCDYFFVTEFNAGVTGVKSQDGVDRFLFTDALGLMKNIDHSRAIGASIEAHLTAGATRFAPTIRFKQWLKGRSSVDLSLGYAITSIQQSGVAGPIIDVRYSPNAWFHIQAGACRIRDINSIYYYPVYRVEDTSEVQAYVGAGLGGVPALVSWGAQAVGAVTLIALLSGMN